MTKQQWYHRARARITHGDLAPDFRDYADLILYGADPCTYVQLASDPLYKAYTHAAKRLADNRAQRQGR